MPPRYRKPRLPSRRVFRRRRFRKRYGRGFSHGFSNMYKTVSKYTNWPTVIGAIKDIQGMINAEKQKVDVSISTSTISSTPAVTHLTAIATGDSEGSRTANSILCKYLYINGTVQIHTSANFSRVRMVVVRDKQQVGDTAPAYLDVFESAPSGSGTQAFLNKATVGRFDILWDRLCVLDAQNPQVAVSHMIPLKSHVRYNGTASTDVQKGGLYCMLVSDITAGGNVPTVYLQARLAYYDN